MIRIIAVGLMLAVISCKSSKSVASESEIQSTIEKYLGPEYMRQDNENLALCYTKPEYVGSEWKTIIVLNIKTLELIYGPEKLNSKVKWHGPMELEFRDQSEAIQDKQSGVASIRYYNLSNTGGRVKADQ